MIALREGLGSFRPPSSTTRTEVRRSCGVPEERRARTALVVSVLLVSALVVSALAGITGGAALAEPRAPRPNAGRDHTGLIKRVAVFGTDDRVAVPKRLAMVADQVGLFFSNRARTVCSAFCVAPNIIATAAHCLAQPGGKPARLSDFMFARGYDRQRDFARIDGHETGSAPQNVITGDFRHRVRPPIDAANDWALVRLQRNACPGSGLTVTPLPVEDIIAAAKAGKVFQVSYHRDWTQWRPSYSKPCQVGRDFGGVPWMSIAPDFLSADQMILHLCDTGGASSGSPLLIDGKAGIAVIGINVGTYVQSKILTDRGQVTLRERAENLANTAVNARAFDDRIRQLKSATILASGLRIRDLQEQLSVRKFYRAKVDGSYGPMLKAAIESYERASRMPITGLPTAALLERLDATAGRGLGRVAPTSAPRPIFPDRR